MGCYLEILERKRRVVHADRPAMLESFVRLVGQFRDDHAEDYELKTHEMEQSQYGSKDVVLQRLIQLSFCVSGSVNQSHKFVNFSLPQLSSENMSSVIRTILSWCLSRCVRILHSTPGGLVAESSDVVGRAIELGAVRMDDLWEEVDRASTDGYRESVCERMGLNLDGNRADSPEIGGEHRF